MVRTDRLLQPLVTEVSEEIFEDSKIISSNPCFQPNGGFIYVFEWKEERQKEDWRADGFRWRQGGSSKYLMPGSGNSIGMKRYFQSIIGKDKDGNDMLSLQFTRTTFHHPTQQKVLVIYKGDETISSKLPHGNSKSDELKKRPFVATMPSLLRDMEQNIGEKPSKIYRKMSSTMPREIKVQAAQGPRNLKQVQNTIQNANQKLRLTRDTLYNLHARAVDGTFVKQIITFPDLIVIGWDDNLAEVFSSLLGIPQPIGLFYDTTFKLGDFYVSILSFEETEFTKKPTIPLICMLHERKTFETHNTFWREVTYQFPGLAKAKNAFIVTDEEAAIVAAMTQNLPQTEIYRCWNNVLQNAKIQLRKLGLRTNVEVSVYLDDIRQLFSQPDNEKYNHLLLKFFTSWNKEFSNYFRKFIHKDVDRLGLWVIKKHGLTSATNNCAESLNALLKRFVDWKESPADTMILALEEISASFYAEIKRGRYGLGVYHLHQDLTSLYDLNADCPVLPEVRHEKDIFDTLRNAVEKATEAGEDDTPVIKLEEGSDFSLSCAYERASRVIEKKHVEFNFNRIGTFNVTGTNATRDVRIFPNPSCSCPETKICYHIMAARLACGLANTPTKKKPNVTQLRKNARKKADKTSGRKRPRPNDVTKSQSIWEDLNGDRCGSDGYDPFYANVASPPRKKSKGAPTTQKDSQKHDGKNIPVKSTPKLQTRPITSPLKVATLSKANSPATKWPVNSPASLSSANSSAAKSPVNSMAAKSPANSSAAKSPINSPAAKSPANSSAAKSPINSPASLSSANSSATKSPANSSATKSSVNSPASLSSVNSPASLTSANSSAAKSPAKSSS